MPGRKDAQHRREEGWLKAVPDTMAPKKAPGNIKPGGQTGRITILKKPSKWFQNERE